MSRNHDVAVLGGGIVAHALALMLARDRLRVALVHPSVATAPVTPTDIRAYALNRASRELLTLLKVWPDGDDVTPVGQMWVAEPNGDDPASIRLGERADDPLAWIVDVPALEDRLADAVRYQPGIDVVDERPTARLTVVCEGKRSQTRDALGIEFDVRPYDQTAVAARAMCARPHGGIARQWFDRGEVLALLPMGGSQGRAVAVVWSLPHDRAREMLAMDTDSLGRALEIACDHALGDMQVVGVPAAWPLELSVARDWVRPGLALAGDAAHAMHPLAGQGLNVGLGDVAALAGVIHGREYWRDPGDMKLLRRYERERKSAFARMAQVTDGLYGLFGHPDDRIQTLRRWGLRTFDRLTPLKHWAIRQAAGHTPSTPPPAT